MIMAPVGAGVGPGNNSMQHSKYFLDAQILSVLKCCHELLGFDQSPLFMFIIKDKEKGLTSNYFNLVIGINHLHLKITCLLLQFFLVTTSL